MQQKLEILPLYQLYIPIQARQLLLPWSEKSKSSEQRSVYSKPEVQGICRDHILLKFEENLSINVYICIDQSGNLWKSIEHICQEWIHTHDAWRPPRRGRLNQAGALGKMALSIKQPLPWVMALYFSQCPKDTCHAVGFRCVSNEIYWQLHQNIYSYKTFHQKTISCICSQ